jgi:hypothetical protein
MVGIEDIFEVSGNKMINDIQKSMIRRKDSPCVAENKCISIDVHEMTEHLLRFLKEYNEWLLYQQRLQAAVFQNFICYYQY